MGSSSAASLDTGSFGAGSFCEASFGGESLDSGSFGLGSFSVGFSGIRGSQGDQEWRISSGRAW